MVDAWSSPHSSFTFIRKEGREALHLSEKREGKGRGTGYSVYGTSDFWHKSSALPLDH
jgi:hypothetical protein